MEIFIIVFVILLLAQYCLITALLIEGYIKTKKMFVIHYIPIVGLITIISKVAFEVLEGLNDFYKNLD